MKTPPRCYRFGDFELDESLIELRCEGRVIPLQPKPLHFLLHLIAHRQRVVPRDELLGAVWAGTAVSNSVLSSALREIRRALADDVAKPRWIRTRHKLGYQFVGRV